jgi:arginase family enzyme
MKIYSLINNNHFSQIKENLGEYSLNESFNKIYFSYPLFETENKKTSNFSFEHNSILLSNDYYIKDNYNLRSNFFHNYLSSYVLLTNKLDLQLFSDFDSETLKKMIFIGVNDFDKYDLEFFKEKNIPFFTNKAIFSLGLEEFCDIITEKIRYFDSFDLLIDLNVLDSKNNFGGLLAREILYLLQRLKKGQNMKSCEITNIRDSYFNSNVIEKIIRELS